MAALLIGALSGASPFVPPPTAHGAAAAFFPPPNGHDGQWQQGVRRTPPPPQQQVPAPSLDPREQEPRRKKGQPERRYTLEQWRTGLYAVAAEHARGSRIKVGAPARSDGVDRAHGRLMMCTD